MAGVAVTGDRLPDAWDTSLGQRVEVYPVGEPPARRWYWHLKAANGRIIADGGQGYRRRRTAVRAALRLHPTDR